MAKEASLRREPWVREAKKLFEGSRQRIFTRKELGQILAHARKTATVPGSVGLAEFVEELSAAVKLRELQVVPHSEARTSPARGRAFSRYAWGEPSPYTLALSLRSGSYLSHASAMFLQGLTDRKSKKIYVNREQREKWSNGSATLSQDSIDRAFARSPRTSKHIFAWKGFRFVLVSGKYTDRLEVTQINGPAGEFLDVTTLERTLIDIVVRPMYAGGVKEVARAFEVARDRLSINTLVATLRTLDYVYPYHQAIGFYLERAGCGRRQLEKLRSLGLEFDFYLTYEIANKKYDPTWQVYYPRNL